MNSLFIKSKLNSGKRPFSSDAATQKVRAEGLVCLPVLWIVSLCMPIIDELREVFPDFTLVQKPLFGTVRNSNAGRILLIFLMVGLGSLGGFGQTQTFSTSGTFTVPAGVTSVTVQAWGGGGGGSSITISNKEGGGGGGGAYASGSVLVTPGNTYNIVVGAGGVATNNGGKSSFNSTSIVAEGGSGVAVGTTTGGSGGTIAGSTGTIIYAGGKGGDATGGNSGGGGGGAGTTGIGGNAAGQTAGTGTSIDGGDGGSGVNGNANGIAGINFGGGGSGASKTNGTDRTGGDGAAGQVKISWVCTIYNINSAIATTVCTGDQSIVTLTASSVNDLPIGGYVVSYNLGAPNAGSYTGVLTVSPAGTGTFTTSNLSNPGNTSINITNLGSGSGTQICSNAISSGNTTTIRVLGGTLSPSTQNVCQLNSNISNPITLVGTYDQIIRWEKSADGGANWTNINKIINPLVDDFDSYGTLLVRAVIANTDGSVVCYSGTTQVIVDQRATVTGYGGSNKVKCLGQTINNLNASPGAVTRWEYKYSATDPSDWSVISWIPIAGTSQSIYSPTPLLAGYYKYHAIISNGSCVNVPTTNATWEILVNPSPTLSTVTQSATICENNPVTINLTGLVAGSTFSLTYTINGGSAISVSGLTAYITGNSSFTTGNLIASNNGQNLRITGITITSSTPNCTNTFTKDVTLNVNQKSTDPTSATASSTTICNGQSTYLSLNGGGGGTGTVIHWYTVSCGGTTLGTGNSLSVSPTTSTTYYGRYEDGSPCSYNSACSTVTITVNQKSADPTSATASSTTICNGGSTTLTLNGGGGGTGETIKWYTASCGGTPVGTGNSLSVSPTTTTTYYGRYEDGTPCSYNSACSTVTITVNQKSADPTSATASSTTICNGGSTTLTLNGGGGGTGETIKWYTASCGGTPVGTGNSLSVSPTTTTTYYGRYEDGAPCSYNSACSTVTITINQKSADPTSATASSTSIFIGQSTSLLLNGGGGGTGTLIHWYSGSCGGTPVGTGNNLLVSPTVTTTYYGRYEDPAPCSILTICRSVVITVTDHLAISKTITATPSKPGDPFNYQITYSNLNASGNATSVVIKDVLPTANYFNYVSSTPAGTFDNATRTITWNIDSLRPGTYPITITGKLGTLGSTNYPTYDPASYYITTGGLIPTNISNTATIESSTISPISIPAPVTNSVTQYCGPSMPANIIGYIKSSSNTEIFYLITLTNSGNITDKFDLTKIYTGQNLYTYIETIAGAPLPQTPWIAPNNSYSFIVRYVVPNGTPAGSPDNITTVKATSFVCGTTASTIIDTDIYSNPPTGNNCDMQIAKTASPNPVVVGNNLVYTITVLNSLPQASNVSITDALPSTLTYVPSSVSASPTSALTSLYYDSPSRSIKATKNSQKQTDDPIVISFSVTPNCDAIPLVTNTATVSTSTHPDINSLNDVVSVTTIVNSYITAPTAAGTTICQGSTASLTASDALVGYGYRWYDASSGGNLLYTGSPYITGTLNATTTYYVSIYLVSSPTCESNRTPVTATVLATPTYTTHPSPVTICSGNNTSFTIVASGTLLTYQWQVNSGSGWSDLSNVAPYSGVNTTTLTLTNVSSSLNIYLYRCVTQTGTCSGINSNSATLTVKTNVAITSAIAAASPICSIATTTLTANGVTGTNALVTWWAGAGGTGTNLGTVLTLANKAPGTYYARVTGDCGIAAEATVTVASKVDVAIISASAAANPICSNATTTLTANGVTGTNAVVTWWTGAGGTGTNLGYGLTLDNRAPGTYYARVTGDCGTADEVPVTIAGDTEAPTFTLPATFPAPSYLAGFCPADIYRAEFNNVPPESPYDLTYLRPDYYLFGAWFNILDITDVADNCALRVPPFDPVLNPDPISWVIHFAITTPLTPDLTGSGQISLYGTDIHFPVGDNTITYTVTDKAGVPTVKSVTLTVIPRPIMTKNP